MSWVRLTIALAVSSSGCMVTPHVPIGSPLAPKEVAARAGWGTSYGPSTARVVAEDGEVHVLRGNGDSTLGAHPIHPGLLQFQLLGVRGALSPHWDAGAYAGWYGAGGGIRYRLTAPDSRFASHVGVDGQLGYQKPTALRLPYAGRLLSENAAKLGQRFMLLGNLGASAGRRRHGINLESVMTVPPIDGVPGIPAKAMSVERHEIRLEGGLGFGIDASRIVAELLVSPYLALHQGAARGVCRGNGFCETLVDYRQAWGVNVLVNLSGRMRGHEVAGPTSTR